MTEGHFTLVQYSFSQTITLRKLVGQAMKMVSDYTNKQVDDTNMNEIAYLESNLRLFCSKNGLNFPEVAINKANCNEKMFEKKGEPFSPKLFGAQAVAAKKNAEYIAEMTAFIKEKMNSANILNEQTVIYFSDMHEFNDYFLSTTFEKHADVRSHAMMILKDNTKRKFDLVFTTDGIVSVIKDSVKTRTPYNEVIVKGDSILLYRNEILLTREYKALSFDIKVLYSLIRELGSRFAKNLDDKTEYISGEVTPMVLIQWFKDHEEAMDTNVTRIIARPTADIMKHLGYHSEEELDPNKNLIQYYYDNDSGQILGLRVVRFDQINSNFQALLVEEDMIRYELEGGTI
jgi:hypothetical protein